MKNLPPIGSLMRDKVDGQIVIVVGYSKSCTHLVTLTSCNHSKPNHHYWCMRSDVDETILGDWIPYKVCRDIKKS
jgi:hypothetical protein